MSDRFAQRSPGRSRAFGVAALVLAMTAWGVTFGMNRWMLGGTPLAAEPWPGMTLSALRFAVAAPVLVVWAAVILVRRRRRRLSGRDWGHLALLGLLGVPIYHLTANTAQTFASASLNAVLHQMTPAIAFAGGLLLLREKLTAWKLVGLAVASAGAVWYSVVESGAALVGDNIPAAVFLVLAVSIDWTLYLIVAKRALRRWNPVELSVLANAVGAVMLLGAVEAIRPAGAGVTWGILAQLSPQAWVVLVFLALVAGVVCYVLYNVGLQRVEGSRAAVFGYLLVPAAMVSALFLPGTLRESLSPGKVAAAALIVAGVWLVTRRRKSGADEEAEAKP